MICDVAVSPTESSGGCCASSESRGCGDICRDAGDGDGDNSSVIISDSEEAEEELSGSDSMGEEFRSRASC